MCFEEKIYNFERPILCYNVHIKAQPWVGTKGVQIPTFSYNISGLRLGAPQKSTHTHIGNCKIKPSYIAQVR